MTGIEKRFVFINDPMNMGLMEALEKCKELDIPTIAAVSSPRDTDASLDVWLFEEPNVVQYPPKEALDAVLGNIVTVIEDGSVTEKSIEILSRHAEINS